MSVDTSTLLLFPEQTLFLRFGGAALSLGHAHAREAGARLEGEGGKLKLLWFLYRRAYLWVDFVPFQDHLVQRILRTKDRSILEQLKSL